VLDLVSGQPRWGNQGTTGNQGKGTTGAEVVSHRVRYIIAYNRRSPKRMQPLRDACDEVNRRRIHHRGRLLVLELDQPEGGG
jgi:hypothetical protein